MFVDSVDVCIARVAERVRKGGHDVPEADIRRRYGRSIGNFWTDYRDSADSWAVLYNGGSQIQDVAVGSRQNVTVRDATLHANFLDMLNRSMNRTLRLAADMYASIDELVRLGSIAVNKAQNESRRLGVPNVYAINGRLYYETRTANFPFQIRIRWEPLRIKTTKKLTSRARERCLNSSSWLSGVRKWSSQRTSRCSNSLFKKPVAALTI